MSDREIVDDSFDVGILIVTKNQEDLQKYLDHPIHQKAKKEVLLPLVEKNFGLRLYGLDLRPNTKSFWLTLEVQPSTISNLAATSPVFVPFTLLKGMMRDSRAFRSFTLFKMKSFWLRGSPLM